MRNLYSNQYLPSIYEGAASEHPDVKGQSAFAARADAILAARAERRKKAERAKANAAKYAHLDAAGRRIKDISTIRREEFEIQERQMTSSEMKKEEKLKDKYDDSEMKLNFIKQYGKEKGKQYYFAYIRKKAMAEDIELEEAQWGKIDYVRGILDSGRTPFTRTTKAYNTAKEGSLSDRKRANILKKQLQKSTGYQEIRDASSQARNARSNIVPLNKEDYEFEEEYKELPRKKMLTRAGKHNFYAGWVQGEWETNRFNKGKKRNITKEMVNDATSKANKIYDTVLSHDPEAAKAKSKYKSVKESYDYDELLDEAKISRTERRARNAGKKGYDKTGRRAPRGAIHAFDVDETIFSHGVKGKPNVQVHVNDPSGKRVQSLTNQEFNTHKLPKGHSYDFGEFRSAKKFAQTTSPNKSVIKKIKKLQRRGKRVQLITARDKFDNPEAFRQHFVRHGIHVKPGDIHYTGGMKGSDVGQKKVAVGKGLAKMHGASSIHMYDDAAKVHKAFEAEKGKSRRLKIKTHLAKPNKRGEVMLRSYQATKEDFELWIENLLDEGYDLSDFTVDELYETFEYVLDEAITAVGASGGDRPFNKHPRKKMMPNMTKPVTRFTDTNPRVKPVTRDTDTTPKIKPMFKGPNFRTKKDYKEELELTPYEYWKSFIFEDEDMVDEYEVEENELDEEIELTPYDMWKLYCSERMSNEV